jgi:hypothetical protein
MSNQGRRDIDARSAPLLCSACLHRLDLMLGRQCLLSRKAVDPEPGSEGGRRHRGHVGTHTGWNVYQRLTMTSLLLLVPLILVVACILANRAVYEIASRNGYYCAASLGLAGSTTEKIGAAQALFSIK